MLIPKVLQQRDSLAMKTLTWLCTSKNACLRSFTTEVKTLMDYTTVISAVAVINVWEWLSMLTCTNLKSESSRSRNDLLDDCFQPINTSPSVRKRPSKHHCCNATSTDVLIRLLLKNNNLVQIF